MALYRKYRPSSFEEFVNQEAVKQALKNAIERDEVAHAYVFSGPRGTGKTSMARIFAKALGTEDLDLIEIDGATYTKIDDMREVIAKVGIAPTVSRYKVYVIDEVHMLSTYAFNALLKTLEEPPRHVIFVLVTTELHKIPATVLSRCQRFEFRRITDEEVAAQVIKVAKAESIELPQATADLLAQAAGGSLRDALSHLEQLIALNAAELPPSEVAKLLGVVEESILAQLMERLVKGDALVVINLLEELSVKGFDAAILVRSWAKFIQRAMLASAQGDTSLSFGLTVEVLAKMLGELVQLEAQVKASSLPFASVEVYVLEWAKKHGVAQVPATDKPEPPSEPPVAPVAVEETPTDTAPPQAPKEEPPAQAPVSANAPTTELWKNIVTKIRLDQPYLATILEQGSFTADEEKAVVALPSQFFLSIIKSQRNWQALLTAIDASAGRQLKVEAVADPGLSPTLSPEATKAPMKVEDISRVFG